MQKTAILIFTCVLMFGAHTSQGQKIMVGGKQSNGTLQWNDFTGKVDKNSSFQAYTAYKFNTKMDRVRIIGDSVAIDGFEVILELDPKNSWVRKEKATDALLVHEQGHFNLGILTIREILSKFKATKFSKKDYQKQLQQIIDEAAEKYNALGVKYDKETDHSKDTTQQAKWNEFFSRQFAAVH